MQYRTLSDEEYRDAESRILYEDNHLLVVNKRAGEIVQADKTSDETLTDLYKSFIAMRDAKPGSVFLGVPHRLDRPVSGITILSKTSKALVRLNEMFRTGGIHKYYWALVCAGPPQPEGKLSGYIWRNEAQNKSYMCRPGSMRKDARLADRQTSSDQMPAFRYGVRHQRRSEIRSPAFESGRLHQPSFAEGEFHPSCQKRGDDHRGPSASVLGQYHSV